MVKTGHLLYSSALFFEACLKMAEMAEFASAAPPMAARFRQQAERTKAAINALLWDPVQGGYRASTGVESAHIDVWGTGLAAFLNITNTTQAAQAFRFFADNRDKIFFEGQVREIVAPQRWTQMRGPQTRDWSQNWDGALGHVYQDGGYWATPHNVVLPFVSAATVAAGGCV